MMLRYAAAEAHSCKCKKEVAHLLWKKGSHMQTCFYYLVQNPYYLMWKQTYSQTNLYMDVYNSFILMPKFWKNPVYSSVGEWIGNISAQWNTTLITGPSLQQRRLFIIELLLYSTQTFLDDAFLLVGISAEIVSHFHISYQIYVLERSIVCTSSPLNAHGLHSHL